MPSLVNTLIVYILANGVLSLVFMALARREFGRQGKWSRSTAVMSGVVMHGHAVATCALAWFDHGRFYALDWWVLCIGFVLFFAGGVVIALGRTAYGSQERVYGLLEDELIEAGIYRVTRNPQYVGYAGMFLGAGIASGSAWALASSGLFILTIHLFITRVEEPHLKTVFGQSYAAYCERVRRYL
jgi:protein-S-isoprenylcysteine O-methyltransferase Ste14